MIALAQIAVSWTLVGGGVLEARTDSTVRYRAPTTSSGLAMVIATRRDNGKADTTAIRIVAGSGGLPGGSPYTASQVFGSGSHPHDLAITGTLDGYIASVTVDRIKQARSEGVHLLMNLASGGTIWYLTNGKFDLNKWKARLDTYRVKSIQDAVALAVADGTIAGASVMDEPFNPKWGPSGTLTKVMVDEMCGYVRGIFPTIPVGVTHDAGDFEPSKSYKVCDYIMAQYRWSKTRGDVQEFIDEAMTLAQRDGHDVGFSLNILHGGIPDPTNPPAGYTPCRKYEGGEDGSGRLCPMTPEQVRAWGTAMAPKGCFLNMWQYVDGYWAVAANRAAIEHVAGVMAPLERRECRRTR